MSGLRSEHGFTLIELLVAMTISMIVLGATFDALAGFTGRSRATNVQNDAQDSARHAIDQLAYELRNAVSSGTPIAPVEKATEYDLIFQTVELRPGSADANALRLKRVRYCLDFTVPSRERLFKQTQRLTSSATPAPASSDCPSSAWNTWGSPVVVADWLVNRIAGQSRPVFAFSRRPVGSTDPIDIAGIQANVFVNVEPANARGGAELTSAVRLRNANRRPTAAFTVTQQNGYVLLNASASRDPEGQPLTYQWSLNGSALPGATNQRLDHAGLISGTSHDFTLQVTDPGGLSAQQTQRVIIQ